MFNSSVVAANYGANKESVCASAMISAAEVYKKSGNDPRLYTSFIMRLRYAAAELEKSGSYLVYPILIGCLYDRENKNGMGREFLELAPVSLEFKELSEQISAMAGWEPALNTQCPGILWPSPYSYNGAERVAGLEGELDRAMEAGDYDGACGLLDRLLSVNPLSRGAMYHRIRISAAAWDWELAAVLAGTAMALWPVDTDMQRLCWELMTALPKNSGGLEDAEA
jgi:hypothetical protein